MIKICLQPHHCQQSIYNFQYAINLGIQFFFTIICVNYYYHIFYKMKRNLRPYIHRVNHKFTLHPLETMYQVIQKKFLMKIELKISKTSVHLKSLIITIIYHDGYNLLLLIQNKNNINDRQVLLLQYYY